MKTRTHPPRCAASSLAVTAATTLAAALAFTFAATCAHAAGFQRGLAVDPDGKPLEIGIWYPSLSTPAPVSMGPTTMSVAINAPMQGKDLPLVVMSHGNGGSYLSHFDTAVALADAGFVVVAVTHTGDSYADQSRSIDVMARPRHISRAIDHMLSTWDGHAAINPARIGVFGFSTGGFTALASIGGVPDFSKIAPNCAQYPGDYACQLMSRSAGQVAAMTTPAPTPAPTPAAKSASTSTDAVDLRIKAAVVAAPALGFTFSANGLKNVRVPVQLWRADSDVVVPHPRYAEVVRLALPQAPDYRVVSNAGHYDFLAPCSSALASIAPPICSSAAGFDRAAFHVGFNAAVVSFFSAKLAL